MAEKAKRPRPRPSTVNVLYGQAYRCAFPGCPEPLISEVNGVRRRNSVVAHMHAQNEGGARYIEMSDEDNRRFENLILLCENHHALVDDKDLENEYPIEKLRQWKEDQLQEYVSAHKNWELSDKEVQEILDVSYPIGDISSKDAMASSAKSIVRLIEICAQERKKLTESVSEWEELVARANSGFIAYDPETGEKFPATPAGVDRDANRKKFIERQISSQEKIQPLVVECLSELAALKIVRRDLEEYCQSVEECLRALIEAIEYIPKKPPFFDDAIYAQALENVRRSSVILEKAWQYEDTSQMIQVVKPEPEPQPSEEEVMFQEWWKEKTLRLDSARPHVRATKLEYDKDLMCQLILDSKELIYLPKIVSYMSHDFNATLGVASSIAKNATDEEVLEASEFVRGMKPEVVEATFIFRLARTMEDLEREELLDRLKLQYQSVVMENQWSDVDWWDRNGLQVNSLIYLYEDSNTTEETKEILSQALNSNNNIYSLLVENLAPWVESMGFDGDSEATFRRHYRSRESLPAWFPLEKVIQIGQSLFPNIEPQRLRSSTKYDNMLKDLTAQLLAIHHELDIYD